MAFESGLALLVGASRYQYHDRLDAPIAASDAEEVRKVLQNPEFCGYIPTNVNVLSDAAVSKQGLLAALDTLAQQANENSTVFLYYTGHGDYGTDGQYYFLTHDVRLDKNKVVAGTGVSEAEFVDKLRLLKAKRVLVIINSCHSGEVSPNLSAEEPEALGSASPSEETANAILGSGEGRIFITACRPDQKSWIGVGKLSLFAQTVVDGLSGKGYASNNGGYISAYGLYEQVYSATKAAADKLKKVQEPELTVLRGVGPFPVSLYRGATTLKDFSAGGLPEDTAAREVEPKLARRMFENSIKNVMTITGNNNVAVQGNGNVFNTGSGAVATSGGVAAGAGGIAVGGNVHGGIRQGTRRGQRDDD